jgi:hypothetical protein
VGKFFKCLGRLGILRMVPWASRELAVTHGAHLATQGFFTHRHSEFFPNPLSQITQTPPNDAIQIRCGPAFQGLRQRRSLFVVQQRRLARSLAVDQAVGTSIVEAHHPVAHDLNRNAAEPGCIGARAAIIYRCKRKKTTSLVGISCLPSQKPQLGPIKI